MVSKCRTDERSGFSYSVLHSRFSSNILIFKSPSIFVYWTVFQADLVCTSRFFFVVRTSLDTLVERREAIERGFLILRVLFCAYLDVSCAIAELRQGATAADRRPSAEDGERQSQVAASSSVQDRLLEGRKRHDMSTSSVLSASGELFCSSEPPRSLAR